MHQVALMRGGRESPRMGREEGLLRALLCHHVLKQHGERTLEHPEICPHTSAGVQTHREKRTSAHLSADIPGETRLPCTS